MPYLYEIAVTIISDLCILGLAVGCFFLWRTTVWARPKRLLRLSKQLEMEYLPESVRLPRKLNNNFPLTTTGTDRRMFNVLSGHYRDVEMFIFDYEFLVEGKRIRTSVYAFELRRSGVCRFASCPRDKVYDNPLKYWDGVKPITVGKNDKAQKAFSARHKLVGLNEFGTALQFNPKAVSYFARRADFWTEGGGNWLLVHELGHVTPVNQMPRQIWKAYQVCRMLQLNNNRVNVDELDENDSASGKDKPNLMLAS
jgi:hypothetical protein